tara:strand:- start:646 stop:1404 length:759 start_codon:yes stop_codon:yes gene_type:complete
MAIDVNKVYTTVLSILNKKGSGYMTPDNFNKIAPIVQLELLDRAFYEYNRAVAKQTSGRGAQGYGDIPRKIMDKLDPFCASATLSQDSTNTYFLPPGYDSTATYPESSLYATLSVKKFDKANPGLHVDIERIEKSKIPFLFSSKLTAPSETFPVYYNSEDFIYVFPNTITSVEIYYVKKPSNPTWNSTADTTSFGTPIYEYQQGLSIDFTLHPSDEADLILGILKYFGVTIKDPLVIQAAQQEEQSITQQEQ